MNILITLYGNTERYPPTINAIECLSTHATKIDVFHRAHQEKEWTFTQNVTVISDGKVITPREQEKLPIHKKIGLLFRFCRKLLKLANTNKYDLILIYDAVPLLAYQMIKPFLKHKMVAWYHNHDVIELQKTRKYSINWWAAKADINMMPHIDIFSLPSQERKKYFQLDKLKGKYFFLPNFPAKRFYAQFESPIISENVIKIIYQGSVSKEHGLEACLEILPYSVNGKSVELHLAGPASAAYIDSLKELAVKYKVPDRFFYHGIVPYRELPKLTSSCHIGIGINVPKQLIYQTGGTASNKIYEYTAVGLPFLYYNDKHYNKYLEKYEWAFPVNLKKNSILSAVEEIDNRFEELSLAAKETFVTTLNFEEHFKEVLEYLKDAVKNKKHK